MLDYNLWVLTCLWPYVRFAHSILIHIRRSFRYNIYVIDRLRRMGPYGDNQENGYLPS